MKDKNLIKHLYNMDDLSYNIEEVKRWFNDNGDYTHNVTYDLNESSIIMDLGGYTGSWCHYMVEKYNPNVYVLEPIPQFYEIIKNKFKNNDKVRCMCSGVSVENKVGELYVLGDATSSNRTNGDLIKVDFKTIETILTEFKLDSVDVLQINIEGDEYPLLEYMLRNGSINKFKNIQIQFHLGIENCFDRRDKIRDGLIKNNFKLNFDYQFVWESWCKI